jgi:hypothetical protein
MGMPEQTIIIETSESMSATAKWALALVPVVGAACVVLLRWVLNKRKGKR